MPTLEHVCIVHGLLPDEGRVGVTAIDKRPVAGPVRVHELGLRGDTQTDRKHHGGPHRAVYVVSDEDAAVIETELGRRMPVGWMGENFRVAGAGSISGVLVGERWQVGDVVIEFTQPRMPCATFARFVGEGRYVKRFTDLGRPGGMCAVLTPGTVEAGQDVTVVHRPDHGLTLGMAFTGDIPDAVAQAYEASVPPESIARDVAAALSRLGRR